MLLIKNLTYTHKKTIVEKLKKKVLNYFPLLKLTYVHTKYKILKMY